MSLSLSLMAIALMGGTKASAVCTQGFATKQIIIIEMNCEAPGRTFLDAFAIKTIKANLHRFFTLKYFVYFFLLKPTE